MLLCQFPHLKQQKHMLIVCINQGLLIYFLAGYAATTRTGWDNLHIPRPSIDCSDCSLFSLSHEHTCSLFILQYSPTELSNTSHMTQLLTNYCELVDIQTRIHYKLIISEFSFRIE